MPSMTTDELKKEALFDAQEKTDGSSDFDSVALRYMNEVYYEVLLGGGKFGMNYPVPWTFIMKDGAIVVEPVISTGTVSVTNGSNSITFSTAPSQSVKDWFFVTPSAPSTVYKIASHTAGQANATLDTPYLGQTNSSSTYRLAKLDYALPADLLNILEPIVLNTPFLSKLEYVSEIPVSYVNMTGGSYAYPAQFTFVTTPGQQLTKSIRINAAPATERVRLDFKYLYLPPQLTGAAGEEPILPKQYRSILSNGTTYWILLMKNDDRAAVFGKMVEAKMEAMVQQNNRELAAIGLGPKPTLGPGGRRMILSQSGVMFRTR